MTSYTSDWHQPAETTPHKCTLMAYPNSTCSTGGDLLLAAQKEVVPIANAIAEFEPVTLFASPDTLEEAKALADKGVSVASEPKTSHLWIRDFGPTDCHVDALALFAGSGKVVLGKPSPTNLGRYVGAYNDARRSLPVLPTPIGDQ